MDLLARRELDNPVVFISQGAFEDVAISADAVQQGHPTFSEAFPFRNCEPRLDLVEL